MKFLGAKESMNENFWTEEPERNMESARQDIMNQHLKEQNDQLKIKCQNLTE